MIENLVGIIRKVAAPLEDSLPVRGSVLLDNTITIEGESQFFRGRLKYHNGRGEVQELIIKVDSQVSNEDLEIRCSAEIYFPELTQFFDPRISAYVLEHKGNIAYVRARGVQSTNDAKQMWLSDPLGALKLADRKKDGDETGVVLDICFASSNNTVSVDYSRKRKCLMVYGTNGFYVGQELLVYVINSPQR